MKKLFLMLLLALQFTVVANLSLAQEPEPRCFPCPTVDAR
jgi:hypothetical protein